MITITRNPLRSLPGQPRRAKWVYSYETERTSVQDWGTSLAELRRMLKRKFPGQKITEAF